MPLAALHLFVLHIRHSLDAGLMLGGRLVCRWTLSAALQQFSPVATANSTCRVMVIITSISANGAII